MESQATAANRQLSARKATSSLQTRRLNWGIGAAQPGMRRWLFNYAPIYYLALLALAELLVAVGIAQPGLALHTLLLVALPIHYAFARHEQAEVAPLLLGLALAPVIRIMSLILPLAHLPLMSWYLIIAAPVFAAGVMVMRTLGMRWAEVGLTLRGGGRGLLIQGAVGLSGLALGVGEFLILHPNPLVNREYIGQVAALAVALVIGTGLLEEFIFRGVMQRAVVQSGLPGGLIYINLVFTVMHIGYLSVADLLFVFAVGFFFSWVVAKSGSLAGVVIAHSLTNIVLYLVMPATGGLLLP